MRQFIASLGMVSCLVLHAAPPASEEQTPPKPAPEMVINMPDGSQKLLSSLRGKVVVLDFIFTTCPHCQHAAVVFTQLYNEYGSKGFQPISVAFNDDIQSQPAQAVNEFVRNFHVGYPVGYSDRAKVLDFLGFSVMDRLVVPQIVWIDRKGMIRSKTTPSENEQNKNMWQDAYWREMVDTLTKEPATPAKRAARTSAKK